MATPTKLTIKRPDDWHVHLRDGAMLEAVAPHSARVFNRVIVMPNLVPPVTTAPAAAAYRRRILAAAHGPSGEPDANRPFLPLMTCYLTDTCDPAALAEGFMDGVFAAAKLYPAGATTNSQSGVTDIAKIERRQIANHALHVAVHLRWLAQQHVHRHVDCGDAG